MTKYTLSFEADNDILGQETYVWRFNGVPIPWETAKTLDDSGLGLAGGYLVGEVYCKDSLGRVAAKTSNSIYYAPVVTTTPPAQMAPPTLAVASPTEIQVFRAADPADGGSPIVGKHLRWSIDNTAWTQIDNTPSGYIIIGLTPSTLYYVQTASENAVGVTWSDSAFATTNAIAASTAPGAIQPDFWVVSAVGTSGDATLSINTFPDPGSAPITGVKYKIGTGSLSALIPMTTPCVVALTDKFVDGVPTNVQWLAVNSVGDGPLANPKSVETYQATSGTVSNQIAIFGQKDLNTATVPAGRFQPVDTTGKVVPITAATYLSGGGLGGRTVVLDRGGFGFIGAAGGPLTGTIIRCTHAGGTVDVTCNLHANANSWAVATYGQQSDAIKALPLGGGGDIIVRRDGGDTTLYDKAFAPSAYMGGARAFTGQNTITGEGSWSSDENGVGHDDVMFVGGMDITGLPYMKFKNISGAMLGNCTKGNNIRQHWDTCHFVGSAKGVYDWRVELPAGYSGFPPYGVKHNTSGGSDSSGVEVRFCLFEYLDSVILYNTLTNIQNIFEYNECRHCIADTCKYGSAPSNTAGVIMRYNYYWGWFATPGSGPNTIHADLILQTGGVDTSQLYGGTVSVYGNIVNPSTGGDPRPQGFFVGADKKIARTFENIVFSGNIVASGSSNNVKVNCKNGVFKNNIVCTDQSAEKNKATANIGLQNAAVNDLIKAGGTIVWKDNIVEAGSSVVSGQSLVQSGNLILGSAYEWATNPAVKTAYNSIFPGYGDGVPTEVFATFKAKYNPSNPAVGPGGNSGVTYGLPRQSAGWNVPAALLVP